MHKNLSNCVPDNILEVEDKNNKQYCCTHRVECLYGKGRKYKQVNKMR